MNSWDWYSSPHDIEEYECAVCGRPMQEDRGVCSNACFEADML